MDYLPRPFFSLCLHEEMFHKSFDRNEKYLLNFYRSNKNSKNKLIKQQQHKNLQRL